MLFLSIFYKFLFAAQCKFPFQVVAKTTFLSFPFLLMVLHDFAFPYISIFPLILIQNSLYLAKKSRQVSQCILFLLELKSMHLKVDASMGLYAQHNWPILTTHIYF